MLERVLSAPSTPSGSPDKNRDNRSDTCVVLQDNLRIEGETGSGDGVSLGTSQEH
jgi:hypothetical protein